MKNRIVTISNGFGRFHLAPLAAEMNRRGLLAEFHTGIWPAGKTDSILRSLSRFRAIRRVLDRREKIDGRYIKSLALCELLYHLAARLSGKNRWPANYLYKIPFRLYSRGSLSMINMSPPNIFHYRSCFGFTDKKLKIPRGVIKLCDHTIAHPLLIEQLAANRGRILGAGKAIDLNALEELMMEDLSAADHVLVNSDFVKETFVSVGVPPEKVTVVYLGVDDKFLATVPAGIEEEYGNRKKESVLFAGKWETRKGVHDLLVAARMGTGRFRLHAVGGVCPSWTRSRSDVEEFQSQVTHLGLQPRAELGRIMSQHRIFVFPSYCEGSARVIFEAMACGCYIITTRNSGSIVKNGIHGAVVSPGNPDELVVAIMSALMAPEECRRIGLNNARLVRSLYLQGNYGDSVEAVYANLNANSTKR